MLLRERAVVLLILTVTWAPTFQQNSHNTVAAAPQPCWAGNYTWCYRQSSSKAVPYDTSATVMNPQPANSGGYGQSTLQYNFVPGRYSVVSTQPSFGIAYPVDYRNMGMQTRFVNGMAIDSNRYINGANRGISVGYLPYGAAGQRLYVDNFGNIIQVANGEISEDDRRPVLSTMKKIQNIKEKAIEGIGDMLFPNSDPKYRPVLRFVKGLHKIKQGIVRGIGDALRQ